MQMWIKQHWQLMFLVEWLAYAGGLVIMTIWLKRLLQRRYGVAVSRVLIGKLMHKKRWRRIVRYIIKKIRDRSYMTKPPTVVYGIKTPARSGRRRHGLLSSLFPVVWAGVALGLSTWAYFSLSTALHPSQIQMHDEVKQPVGTPDRLIWFFVLFALAIVVWIGYNIYRRNKKPPVAGVEVMPPLWVFIPPAVIVIHWLIWKINDKFWNSVLAPWDVFLILSAAIVLASFLISLKGKPIHRGFGKVILVLAGVFLIIQTWTFWNPSWRDWFKREAVAETVQDLSYEVTVKPDEWFETEDFVRHMPEYNNVEIRGVTGEERYVIEVRGVEYELTPENPGPIPGSIPQARLKSLSDHPEKIRITLSRS